MRNRILAGLGVAALATVGIAVPANALSSTTADIWVVHGVPGVEVDVYINGGLAAADSGLVGFQPGEVVPLVDAAPGDYVIDINPAEASPPATITPGDGVITSEADFPGGIAVAAGVSYSLVAHYDAAGDLTLSAFENNLDTVGAGQASVTARHTAAAPAVDIVAAPDTLLFGGVENGQQGTEAVADGEYDIEVQVAGSDPVAVALGFEANLAAGTHYFIHVVGNPDADAPYDRVIFTIGDSPAGVPAGSAGLAAENGAGSTGLIAGGAALLALLIAGGVIVARRMTAEQR
jgi:hypothetical protein